MDILKKRILEAGQYLGKGILKVDGFINHQVDPKLMDQCGKEFSELFKDCGATRILTAEISGIAPALMTGNYMDLPVVYARKHKPVTMPDQVFLTLAPSHTKGRTNRASGNSPRCCVQEGAPVSNHRFVPLEKHVRLFHRYIWFAGHPDDQEPRKCHR